MRLSTGVLRLYCFDRTSTSCQKQQKRTSLTQYTSLKSEIMSYKTVNIKDRVDAITGHWQPELLLTVNDSHSLKIAQIKGPFIWHCHPQTDEVFYCVSGGPFRIELSTKAQSPEQAEKLGRDDAVELKVGDIFCVPQGMQHRPVADVETGILMIEKVGTVNTGDQEGDERTVYVDEK